MASAVSAMVLNGYGEEDSGRGRLSENAPAHATQPPTALEITQGSEPVTTPETTPTAAPTLVSGTYVSDVGSFLEAFCQEQYSISCKNHTKKEPILLDSFKVIARLTCEIMF